MQVLGKFSEKFSQYSLWGIPLYPEEIRGKESLTTFWDSITPLYIQQPSIDTLQSFHQAPQVETPSNLPSGKTELLLFGGKGGVGKTTMACATALRMAQDPPGKNVFLFSMDPAHSLSDCLDLQIGSDPTQVTHRLTAVQINAQAEFEIFKQQYAEEIEHFFNVVSPNLDMTFDREVMERIMDLSPSGLDEVMGLILAIQFMAENRYDFFIFDLAPTGHLIRLLETPELIDQWLKSIFNLFIKYKRVFRLPNITKRLVQMSKNLKKIQALFKDNERTKLYVVSILTEMAFQETNDLVSACEQQLGIHVPLLILNLATLDSNCPFCSARYKLETKIKKKYKKSFIKKHQTQVYRQDEPRGLQHLGKLGETLYLP
jgi:arsenite-transporting ATPase